MPGIFLSLEGGEGVGKSTQARLLAEALDARGISAITTREPGGSEGAEAIRDLLMQGDVRRWSARAEALLFAAARADHLERTIRPALEAGHWVICDRFVDSTRAYQGLAGGVSDEDIMSLHRIGSGGMLPLRTLVLDAGADSGVDAGVEMGLARAEARDGAAADRFAARDATFHAKVAAAFRGFAEQDPARFRLVDARGTREAVTERLMAAIADLLPA